MDIYKVENLSIAYNKENFILQNLNFNIRNEEVLAIVGKSGSGKTSLLYVLTKLIDNWFGKVYFKEQPLNSVSEKEFRKQVAVLLQQPEKQLFLDTVEEELFFNVDEEKRSNFEYILEMLAIDKKYLKYNPFYLSGGYKRKVAIANLLLQDKDIYFFDEPTTGIDIKTKNLFLEVFNEMKKKGKTIIFISHELDFVYEVADKILYVANRNAEIFDKEKFFDEKIKEFNDFDLLPFLVRKLRRKLI